MTVDWVNCVCFYSLGLEQVDLKRFATMTRCQTRIVRVHQGLLQYSERALLP